MTTPATPTALPPPKKMLLAKLVPDEQNPRRHDRRQLEAIKASLTNFGQYSPLVVQAGTLRVLAGNGRYQAMLELGWKSAACLVLALDDAQATLLALADNRSAELGAWDDAALATLLEGLRTQGIDTSPTGFAEAEIEQLLAGLQPLPADGGTGDGSGGHDEPPPSDEEHLADARVVIGPYRFTLPRAVYDTWMEAIKLAVGHDKDHILAELRKRLQLPAEA